MAEETDEEREDRIANEEDARRLQDTHKYNTFEDGPQPVEAPAWNDDDGKAELLGDKTGN